MALFATAIGFSNKASSRLRWNFQQLQFPLRVEVFPIKNTLVPWIKINNVKSFADNFIYETRNSRTITKRRNQKSVKKSV